MLPAAFSPYHPLPVYVDASVSLFLHCFFVFARCWVGLGPQVGVDGDGQPHLAEMTAEGVSYEPVGAVEGLADDAMEHGGMRDLATVSSAVRVVFLLVYYTTISRCFVGFCFAFVLGGRLVSRRVLLILF